METEMKRCGGKNGCGELLPVTDFYKSELMSDGLASLCKKCHLRNGTEKRRLRKYKIQTKTMECRKCELWKPWIEFNRRYRNSYGKPNDGTKPSHYHTICKKCHDENNRKINSELTRSERDIKNAKARLRYQIDPSYKEGQAKRTKIRMETDPLFRLKQTIRGRIGDDFKRGTGKRKPRKTEVILGCSFVEFKEWLERDGLKVSDISKHGLHLDHIIPVVAGKNEQEVLMLNRYSNFRLFPAKLNCSKGDKMPSRSELNDRMPAELLAIYEREVTQNG